MYPSAANSHRKTIGTQTKENFKAICHCYAVVLWVSFSTAWKDSYKTIYFECFGAVLLQFTGMLASRPFIVPIFNAYESPFPPDQAATALSIVDNVGNLAFIFLIRFTGKRRLYLAMGAGIFLSSLVTSVYGFVYLPRGYVSLNQQDQSFRLDNPNLAYIPVISIFLWSFFSNCGFLAMPWMLLPELFSFKWDCFRIFCFDERKADEIDVNHKHFQNSGTCWWHCRLN